MITLLVLCIGILLGTGAILAFTGVQLKKDSTYILNIPITFIFFILFWLSLGGIIQIITYLITGRII